jgi:hypothetical protein
MLGPATVSYLKVTAHPLRSNAPAVELLIPPIRRVLVGIATLEHGNEGVD